MTPARVAVLDVGSNSLRLLCCERIGPDGPEGTRRTAVVGLRRGAAPDGALAGDALARLAEGLGEMGEEIARFAPDATVAVCTSAVREAPNRRAVEELVAARTGARVHVLDGEREAALAFAGASLAAGGDGPVLVIDVGGGSTELVAGAGGVPATAASLPLGAVRQTERHVRHDPPLPSEVAAVRAEAREAAAAAPVRADGAGPALAVAGTATTLAAIELGAYDPARVHGHRLPRARIDALVGRLAAVPEGERRRIPGLDPARAGVIVAGAAILAGVAEAAGAAEVVVSERDILDGAALAAVGALGESFRL